MVFVMIAGAGLIPVDEVVTTKGIVVSQSPTILVQPLETAIVRSIDVREGETVKAGQVLAQLDPTFATADAGALTAQVASIQAEVTRLQAEADGKPLNYTGSDPALRLQSSTYDMRQAERTARLSNYDQKMASLQATIAHGEAEAQMFTQRLAVAQKIEGMRKELAAKQYDTALNSLLATDTRLQVQNGLVSAQNEATTARKDLEAMKAERNAFIQGWDAQVSQTLADEMQNLRDATENLNKASLRQKLVELRAERDAIVQSIAKVSVGSVLQSGQQFLTLVPSTPRWRSRRMCSGRTMASCIRAIPSRSSSTHSPIPNTGWPRARSGPSAPTAWRAARGPQPDKRAAAEQQPGPLLPDPHLHRQAGAP